MVCLLDVAGFECFEDVRKIVQRLWGIGHRRIGFAFRPQTIRPQDVKDEYRMMCDQRTSRFGDDVGVRLTGGIARFLDRTDDIARVFLQRIVHGRIRIALASVIVDAKSAAHVDRFKTRRTEFAHADVDPTHFPQCFFVGADRGDL